MTSRQEEQITHLRLMRKSYGAIAESLNLSVNTVKSFCQRNSLGGRNRVDGQQEISRCDYCGKAVEQTAHRKRKRFCSDACRMKWWREHRVLINRKTVTVICHNCGKEFSDYETAGRKYCCHECYVADRFNRASDERGAVPAGEAVSSHDAHRPGNARNAPHFRGRVPCY